MLERYIDKGTPVLFWACIDMKAPISGPEWTLLDSGETFTWISNEHCMLLVGYDEEGYYFNDPYEGHGLIRFPKQLVEKRHQAQYAMAVGIRK
ncbi:MAG: C39 family peptidase [Frisingicoccus sp.]